MIMWQKRRAVEALSFLDMLQAGSDTGYKPFWVLRSNFIRDFGRTTDANASIAIALARTRHPAVRNHRASKLSPFGAIRNCLDTQKSIAARSLAS